MIKNGKVMIKDVMMLYIRFMRIWLRKNNMHYKWWIHLENRPRDCSMAPIFGLVVMMNASK